MKASKIFIVATLASSGLIGVCVVTDVIHWIKYGYLIAGKEFTYYFWAWLFAVAAANVSMLPFYIISLFSGANRRVSQTFKDSKNFIYTRDLPTYNAAIAGTLYDLKTDYEQEFVACIMDLIVRGYIIEKRDSLDVDFYKVREDVLKGKLSKCEMFLIELCRHNDITRIKSGVLIDFAEKVEEDLLDMGLYRKQGWVDRIKKEFGAYAFCENPNYMNNLMVIIFMFMTVIIMGLYFNWKVTLGVSLILALTIMIVLRTTRLTKVGEKEKESMTKLRHFLERETSFENKEYKERKLWDRYPAFAVALGVNKVMSKEIMRKLNIED